MARDPLVLAEMVRDATRAKTCARCVGRGCTECPAVDLTAIVRAWEGQGGEPSERSRERWLAEAAERLVLASDRGLPIGAALNDLRFALTTPTPRTYTADEVRGMLVEAARLGWVSAPEPLDANGIVFGVLSSHKAPSLLDDIARGRAAWQARNPVTVAVVVPPDVCCEGHERGMYEPDEPCDYPQPKAPSLPVVRTCGECGWFMGGLDVNGRAGRHRCEHADQAGVPVDPAAPPPPACPLRRNPLPPTKDR